MPRHVVVILDARVEGIESDTSSLGVVLGDRRPIVADARSLESTAMAELQS